MLKSLALSFSDRLSTTPDHGLGWAILGRKRKGRTGVIGLIDGKKFAFHLKRRLNELGEARHGRAWSGTVWQGPARLGMARQGGGWQGKAGRGSAWQGVARRGGARQGEDGRG